MKTIALSKAAQAAFSASNGDPSDRSYELSRLYPADAIVKMIRPDGHEYYLRVPGEHVQRLIDIAAGEFGVIVEERNGR